MVAMETEESGRGCALWRGDCQWRLDFRYFVKKLREPWTKAKILFSRLHSAWSSWYNKQLKNPPLKLMVNCHCHPWYQYAKLKFTLIYRLSVQKGTLCKMLNSEKIYCLPVLFKTQHPENQTLFSSTSWLKSNKGVPHGKIHGMPISAFRIFFFTMSSVFWQNILTIPPHLPSPARQPAVVYIMYAAPN